MTKNFNSQLILPLAFFIRRERVFQELEALKKSQWLSRREIVDLQFYKFKSIFEHSFRHTPFYQKLYREAGVDPGQIKTMRDLGRVPICSSDDRVTQLRELIPVPYPGYYSVARTSGTSGKPKLVYVDRLASAAALAARYRSAAWFGIQIGDRQVRFWGRALSSVSRFRESIRDKLLNRMRIASVITYPQVDAIVDKLRKFRPAYFYGYPSLLMLFAEHIRSRYGSLPLDLKAVISTGERLHGFQRETLQMVFGAPVVDEYGCSETDILAFECPSGRRHIMAENVLVEILDRDNRPAESGEVVISSLNNKLMPLIRYRLGDLAVWDHDACPCGRGLPVIKSIEGRTSLVQFIKTPSGKLVHSVFFAYMFEDLVSCGLTVMQFRVVQESIRKLSVMIVPGKPDSVSRAILEQKIRRYFNAHFGEELILDVNMVENIGSNSSTGKLGYFESRVQNV